MPTDPFEQVAASAVKTSAKPPRARRVCAAGLCAVVALPFAAAQTWANLEAVRATALGARPAPARAATATVQLAGNPRTPGGAKPPPRGSSAMLNGASSADRAGGSSADRYGGSSVDKGGVARREAKQTPEEKAAERAAIQAEADAAKKAKADAKGGQAFPPERR